MKAIIIGGGIIGLCSAYYLKQNGWDVVVLDKTDLSDNCSYGNAGLVVPSHFVPLAAPGIVSQGIRWMLSSRSPFYIKPSLSFNLIRWGLHFIRSATPGNVEKAAVPLRDIHLLSKSLFDELEKTPGFDFALQHNGVLNYYKTDRCAREEIHLAAIAKKLGLDAEVLTKNEVQALEPDTELNVIGAVHYLCDAHLYPGKLMHQLLDSLKLSGVIFKAGKAVKQMITAKGKVTKVITAEGEYEGDLVVIAAGSWLPELTKMAGITVPLMPGKGYSYTQKHPQKSLRIPAILCERRVAITPMNGYMRYGGTMEVAAVNNKINLKRVEGIVRSVPEYFPGLSLEMPGKKDIWFGLRPCTPDGLPYIGYSKNLSNLIIAGGHAMCGLSMGPATGKIVSELANGRNPSVNIESFRPERFHDR